MALQMSDQGQRQPYRRELMSSTEASPSLSQKFGPFFLGSKGENTDMLLSFIDRTVKDHQAARMDQNKNITSYISDDLKGTPEFVKAQECLEEKLTELITGLRKYSIPFHSTRYQANLIGDTTLPGIAGYIAGLLYNQNNCTCDASPFTTSVEIQVAKKLVQMLGFPQYQTINREVMSNSIQVRSWAHLTADGTVANLEGLWSARNVKFYPLAVRKALDEDKFFVKVRQNIYVRTARNGLRKRVIECSAWELLNIPCDEALRLTKKIFDQIIRFYPAGIALDSIYARIQKNSSQEIGILDTFEYLRNLDNDKENPIKSPVCFGPATLHYSLPKSMSLLGLGRAGFRTVKIDKDNKQDLSDLNLQLKNCITTKTPVTAVVLVLGTTCEGAIDPISEVLKLRKQLRKDHGLDFNIHVDAAYGGYFASIIRSPTEEISSIPYPEPAPLLLSQYAAKQYSLVGKVDTLTIDPHKSGFIPFACGAFIQRNHLLKYFLAFKAAYISGSPVGMFGVEGSKAGATACAAWLSHECIPLDRFGHGALLNSCLYTTKRLYAQLLDFEDLPFKATCLARLPEERKTFPNLDKVKEQSDRVIYEVARKSHEEISMRLKRAARVLSSLQYSKSKSIAHFIFTH